MRDLTTNCDVEIHVSPIQFDEADQDKPAHKIRFLKRRGVDHDPVPLPEIIDEESIIAPTVARSIAARLKIKSGRYG